VGIEPFAWAIQFNFIGFHDRIALPETRMSCVGRMACARITNQMFRCNVGRFGPEVQGRANSAGGS